MPLPLVPILASVGAGLGAGYLGGKSGGGGIDLNSEFFTKKSSVQTTDASQTTVSNIYSPTVTRTFDIQYNLASQGSTIATKKDLAVSPSTNANQTPSLVVIPQSAQGGGIESPLGSGGSFDFATPLIIAGFVGGGYLLLKGGKKK